MRVLAIIVNNSIGTIAIFVGNCIYYYTAKRGANKRQWCPINMKYNIWNPHIVPVFLPIQTLQDLWYTYRGPKRFGFVYQSCWMDPFIYLELDNCFLKYSMVLVIQMSRFTWGSHPKIFFAKVMSGWRWMGSSSGNGFYVILLLELVSCTISFAKSNMVTSSGFPIFKGPNDFFWFIIMISPDTKSFT